MGQKKQRRITGKATRHYTFLLSPFTVGHATYINRHFIGQKTNVFVYFSADFVEGKYRNGNFIMVNIRWGHELC